MRVEDGRSAGGRRDASGVQPWAGCGTERGGVRAAEHGGVDAYISHIISSRD
jgi:hypothetical protein